MEAGARKPVGRTVAARDLLMPLNDQSLMVSVESIDLKL
jgi:hypothetical protein